MTTLCLHLTFVISDMCLQSVKAGKTFKKLKIGEVMRVYVLEVCTKQSKDYQLELYMVLNKIFSQEDLQYFMKYLNIN